MTDAGDRGSFRYIPTPVLDTFMDAWKSDAEHEVVVLIEILKHDLNMGYRSLAAPVQAQSFEYSHGMGPILKLLTISCRHSMEDRSTTFRAS